MEVEGGAGVGAGDGARVAAAMYRARIWGPQTLRNEWEINTAGAGGGVVDGDFDLSYARSGRVAVEGTIKGLHKVAISTENRRRLAGNFSGPRWAGKAMHPSSGRYRQLVRITTTISTLAMKLLREETSLWLPSTRVARWIRRQGLGLGSTHRFARIPACRILAYTIPGLAKTRLFRTRP